MMYIITPVRLGIDARESDPSQREGMANFQEKKNGTNNIILLLLKY